MRRRQTQTALGLAVVLLAAGCAKTPAAVVPVPPSDLVVLVADPETGTVGAATVSAGGTAVALAGTGMATTIVAGQAPSSPAVLPPDEIQRLFGDALAVLPPPARRYLLYFDSGSDTLTPESKTLVAEILAAVQARTRPDVSVIGHTDTTGAAAANVTLGLRRAGLVRELLIVAGLDAALVEVSSHGEANSVVPTADNTAEARNRRVEVTVR